MTRNFFCALALVSLAATPLAAQTATTRPQPPGTAAANSQYAGAQDVAASRVNQAIAVCLALGNQEEVALAQFAQGRAKQEKVKQFAEMMIAQHREALEKLYRISPQLAAIPLQLDTNSPPGDASRAPANSPTANAAVGNVDQQMVALQTSIAQECLALTQKELGEKQGAEFDQCYIGQQIGAHVAMLAKLKGSEQFASEQLRGFIQDATKTVEAHHQHAKQLAKELMKDQQGSQSAQRTESSRR
jgi:predicted outer membrane protein